MGWRQKNTMSGEEGKNRAGVSHRSYDEAFKRAAVAQWQSGVPASRVAEGLGITTESLRAWRRQFAGASAAEPATPAAGKLPTVAPSAQEPVAEVRGLRAQLQSVTNPRDILKKAVGIFAGPNGSVSP